MKLSRRMFVSTKERNDNNLKQTIMKSTVTKIEINTEKGTFTFSSYESLKDFEKNNWMKLGETSYTVYRKWEDGIETEIFHDGINASCSLAYDIEN